MTKPTPTPWNYKLDETYTIVDSDGDRLASMHFLKGHLGRRHSDEVAANARLIVRAVNAHEAMVVALARCIDIFEDDGYSPTHCDCDPSVGINTCFYCEARAALALARGDDDDTP